jgi:hypothetical protein
MKAQPLIAVSDVERSSRWYQQLLGCQSGHGGNEYEQIVKDAAAPGSPLKNLRLMERVQSRLESAPARRCRSTIAVRRVTAVTYFLHVEITR